MITNAFPWEDIKQPYLDVMNENCLEPVDIFIGKLSHFCHIVVVTLIKIRLLQNIQNLCNSMFLYERLPKEIADKIRKMLVTTAVASNKEIMCCVDQESLVKTLELQLEQLYAAVKSSNKYFWPGLLKPEVHLAAEISHKHIYIDKTSHECEERATLAVKICHDCFVETPGAIHEIEELMGKDTTN